MASEQTAMCYEPLICGTDRLARRPIRPWRAAMLAALRGALRPAGGGPDFGGVAVALNQLALLEAYEGTPAQALALCRSQIALWQRLSARDAGDGAARRLLGGVIQPLINVVRLERWTAGEAGPVSLYAELAPARRGAPGLLLARQGIALGFEALCALDPRGDYAALLDNVYWREYGRYLLQAGRDDDLQALLAEGLSQPRSAFVQLALVEILLLQQARSGKHGSAMRLLGKLGLAPGSLLWLHFRVCAMFLAVRRGDPAAQVLQDEVMEAVRRGQGIRDDAWGLNLLADIGKVFRVLGCAAEETELLRLALPLALRLGDEMVHFDALERLAQLEGTPRAGLHRQFGQSGYAAIRKRLGLAPAAACPDPNSGIAVAAAAQLALGDERACLALLDAAGATPAPAMA